MRRKGPVVAIDGPSGSGKSTVSRNVARKLGFRYVDTGAMYRAFAVAASEEGIEAEDDETLKRFTENVEMSFDDNGHIYVDGRDYTHRIRTPLADRLSSLVSTKGFVRERLVFLQRRIGEEGCVIMEGRDIGTVVFPDADVKIFLVASQKVRAERRYRELKEKKIAQGASQEYILKGIEERDRRDTERSHSPLRRAEDAVLIDTTELSLEEVERKVMEVIRGRLKEWK